MEVYRISKLQKFMTGSKLVMEDGLRFMIMHNLNEFVKVLQNCFPSRVEVTGTNAVKATSGDEGTGLNTKKPLFMLDLVCRDGKLSYNIDLQAYKQVLFSLVDKSLAGLEGLPQLEPLIMNQLFWSSKGNLETMRESDPFVLSIKAKIAKIMDDALIPLEQYLRQYDKHLKLINLDPIKYMQEYEAENHTNEEMEMDILRHIQESETLNREIPTYIHVGMFWVNCDSIKGILRKDLSKVVLDLYARKTSKVAVGISGIFSNVQQKLRERPGKIEELVELREYMKTVPEIRDVQKLR